MKGVRMSCSGRCNCEHCSRLPQQDVVAAAAAARAAGDRLAAVGLA
jgi:hypothetical protein